MLDRRFLGAIAFFLVAIYFDAMGTAIGTDGFVSGTEGDAFLAAMYERLGRWTVLMPVLYFVTLVYLSCLLRYAHRRGHLRLPGADYLSLLILTSAGAGNSLGAASRLIPAWESFHQTLFYGNFLAQLDPTWFLWRYVLVISVGAVIAFLFLHAHMPSHLSRPRLERDPFSGARSPAMVRIERR